MATDEAQALSKAGNKTPDLKSYVKLNVGGKKFRTTLTTLTKDPDSMLARIFSGNFDSTMHMDDDGAYFIDRDGKMFRHILNFLRDGKLVTQELPRIRNEILAEAEFFGIRELIDILNGPVVFKDSLIIKEEYKSYFEAWLPKDQLKWKLAYSGARDGWSVDDFHRCCDGKSPSISLVQAANCSVFGGYTDAHWESVTHVNGTWIPSSQNFLYSFVNVNGISPIKFPANNVGATYRSEGYGPVFGRRNSPYDLLIVDNPNVNECRSTLGGGYTSSGKDSSFLAGSLAFTLTAMEVFFLDYDVLHHHNHGVLHHHNHGVLHHHN